MTDAARRRGAFALVMVASICAVLLVLSALSGAVVGQGGTLAVPSGALRVGTLVLSAAGLLGLARMYGGVRRASGCGQGGCVQDGC
jgi:hypothetical protein